VDPVVKIIARAMQNWDRQLPSPTSEPDRAYVQAAQHIVESLHAEGVQISVVQNTAS
jgi:hypothetical protein